MGMKAQQPFLCIGHRGAGGHAPENTLPSFEKAIELGADWIELDVHNVENELVVIHDLRVDRTTNGHGLVEQHSLAELRALDAGNGAQIPTLREALNLINRRAGVNVELKGLNTAKIAAETLTEYVEQHGWDYGDLLISSFNHPELAIARDTNPKIPRGALLCGIPHDLAACVDVLEASTLSLALDFVTPELIADGHRRGAKVFIYTVNEPDDIARIREPGVDGVFSDFPERVKTIHTNLNQKIQGN